jgi:hypothetical protein
VSDEALELERHPVSGWAAVLEDDGETVYLYFLEPEHGHIAGHTRIHQQGDATAPRKMSFMWSSNGLAVALCADGHPIAFTTAEHKVGFSRNATHATAVSNLWDQALFRVLFDA